MDELARADDEPGAGERTPRTIDMELPHGNAVTVKHQPAVVLVEPFFGGSHKQLMELLASDLLTKDGVPFELCTLPARKWHWRLMASSLHFASAIPRSDSIRVLFVTSTVNLAELLGLRPDLNAPHVRTILYFHENQLAYPYQTAAVEDVRIEQHLPRGEDGKVAGAAVRKVAAEDFQIGWAQIMSCLAADEVVFNSNFNRESFLGQTDIFINKIPEQQLRRHNLADQIRKKSRVLYFPIVVPIYNPTPIEAVTVHDSTEAASRELTILWNHRWEYDKNPDDFFLTLFQLIEECTAFRVIVMGESFRNSPAIFEQAKSALVASPHCTVVHWGYVPTRAQYLELLRASDVVVSTSNHEFYGVAVLEAVMCGGCYPLVPNRLVYPELFSPENLFNTQRQLFKKLGYFCRNPFPTRKYWRSHQTEFKRYTWDSLRSQYRELLAPRL